MAQRAICKMQSRYKKLPVLPNELFSQSTAQCSTAQCGSTWPGSTWPGHWTKYMQNTTAELKRTEQCLVVPWLSSLASSVKSVRNEQWYTHSSVWLCSGCEVWHPDSLDTPSAVVVHIKICIIRLLQCCLVGMCLSLKECSYSSYILAVYSSIECCNTQCLSENHSGDVSCVSNIEQLNALSSLKFS